ncbi:hypothetical protein PV08_05416 [Exophiala spinifera]|uniref:Ig-like domain-containing protein n=1 Tax=Exophiala spinifera TaxID=91928 RepID=A0A0D2B9R5_9EURO|nr:uncharacterized protein PV08_05416 [Exophiala spinifera]KIW15370.1 hypothetical protein PV08_05416 [Exophiala spinifera]
MIYKIGAMRLIAALGPFIVTLVQAGGGGGGGGETTTPCAAGWVDWSTSYVTVPTTIYSTVYSTETDYTTVTTTSVEIQITTIVDTSFETSYISVPVTVPTTIVDTSIETSYVSVPVTVPTTVVETSVETSYISVPVTVPTTIVASTTIVSPTTIVSEKTITSVDVSTVTDVTTTTVVSSTCPPPPLTGLVTCTSRTVNPTYTPKAPLPSNYLWGCPPGTICTPPQIDCNWEQNPPADDYVCSPKECKPLPDFDIPTDWNTTWPNPTEADCAWYEPTLGYFHLDPRLFDLSFAIFDVYGQPVCPAAAAPPPSSTTSGWADWTTPTATRTPRFPRRGSKNILAEIVSRQSLGIAPAACYEVFDNTQLVAQLTGKVYDQLCLDQTPFMKGVRSCQACAATNGGASSTTTSFPKLLAYFNWCQSQAPSK